MQDVEVAFEAETLSALDELAVAEYGGDRDEAVEQLLDQWLAQQE